MKDVKHWYKVTFYAKMDEEDIRAMKGSFFAAMEEAMDIYECENLEIELDRENEEELIPVLKLRESDYAFNEETGQVLIYSEYNNIIKNFKEGDYIRIKYIDEEDSGLGEYIILQQNSFGAICDFVRPIPVE